MQVEVSKKLVVDLSEEQLDDVTAEHIRNTYYACKGNAEEEILISLKEVYKFYTSKTLD